jgi:hypothetical protein
MGQPILQRKDARTTTLDFSSRVGIGSEMHCILGSSAPASIRPLVGPAWRPEVHSPCVADGAGVKLSGSAIDMAIYGVRPHRRRNDAERTY